MVGTLGVVILGGIGAWWRTQGTLQMTKEERYEDGLWKTIKMLTNKSEEQEKKMESMNHEIVALREENFKLREEIYETNVVLANTRHELDVTQRELQAAQEQLGGLQKRSDHNFELEREKGERDARSVWYIHRTINGHCCTD